MSRYCWFTGVLMVGILASFSCTEKHGKQAKIYDITDSLIPEFARKFRMYSAPGYSVIRVTSPWQDAGNTRVDYLLATDTVSLADSLLSGKVIIRQPVTRVVCMSTTHVGMLSALGLDSLIVAVSGTRLVYNSRLQEAIAQGKIAEAGFEGSFDYEQIVRLKPDLILAYGIGPEVTAWYSRMKNLNIPVFYIAEYLEEEPLGRAEWIRLIGRILNVSQKADSFFFSVRNNYLSVRNAAKSDSVRPTVMTGLPWKDAWNVPGGNSYTSRLIADAGGIYWHEELTDRVNYALPVEKAVSKAFEAQLWINAGVAASLSDIRNTDIRLTAIPAFRSRNVFSNTARVAPGGGNDYWESGTVRPDLILNDLYKIIHWQPEFENELFYFVHLK